MNLVYFLTIATISSLIFGEFGKFPFGQNSFFSISLTDILLTLTLIFLFIWKVGIEKKVSFPLVFKTQWLFWAVGLISLIFSWQFRGGLYLLRFIVYSSSFYLGYLLIKNYHLPIFKIFNIFLIFGLVLSILGFIQFLIFPDLSLLTDFGFDPHMFRIVSTFLDPNLLGSFLTIIFFVTFYHWYISRKKYLLICLAILLSVIILTFSRSAYLMLLTQMGVFSLFKYRKLLLAIVVLSLAFYIFVPRVQERVIGGFLVDKSASERVDSWQKGLIIFKNYPVLGVGFNNLRSAMENENLFKVFSENGGRSGAGVDSSIIFILATTGIIGLLAYLVWLLVIIKEFWSDYRKNHNTLFFLIISLMIGLLINSQFINSLFFTTNMLIIYLILGLSFAEIEKPKG